MKPTKYRANLSEGMVVTGIKETVQALNERRVQRLIFCADLAPGAGWQCRDCAALIAGLDAQPERCELCGSSKLRTTDLKAKVIELAYRLGCSIEVRSHCAELEALGGIGAILCESGSGEAALEASARPVM